LFFADPNVASQFLNSELASFGFPVWLYCLALLFGFHYRSKSFVSFSSAFYKVLFMVIHHD